MPFGPFSVAPPKQVAIPHEVHDRHPDPVEVAIEPRAALRG